MAKGRLHTADEKLKILEEARGFSRHVLRYRSRRFSCLCALLCMLSPMRYEWNPAKAQANAAKHGVRFSDAVSVFGDDQALTIDDPHPEEERFVTIGMAAFARLLVVVYTWHGEAIRLISPRKALVPNVLTTSRGSHEGGIQLQHCPARCH